MTRRERRLFLLLVLLAGIAAVFVSAQALIDRILVHANRAQTLERQRDALEAAAGDQVSEELLRVFEEIQFQLTDTQSALAKAHGPLNSEDLSRSVQSFVSEAGMEVRTIRPSSQETEVSASLFGTVQSTFRFLRLLETSQPLLTVLALDIQQLDMRQLSVSARIGYADW